MSTFGIITRFVVAGAIGASVMLGIGAAATPPPAPGLLLPSSTDFELTADTGDVVAQFAVEDPVAPVPPGAVPGATDGAAATDGAVVTPDEPILLTPLPDEAQLTLVAYADGAAPDTGGLNVRPNWLAPTGYPRIQPITQFDGGALGGTNCTMASGAMLARLGFGLVTTGSQLRSLQPDQEGGTSLVDLGVAIGKFGISFNRAALSAIQLRSVMYAGAGAVIQGTYGIIPYELRLQKNFLAGHAIYIDGFRPGSAAGPAAYYVIDPLGRPGAGYRGAWWPADIIEAFAEDFGGGRIYTSWAFPGGKTPTTYPQLPPSAFPTGNRPGTTPPPVVSPAPGVTPSPTPSPPPLPDPDPGVVVPPAGEVSPDPPSGPVWTGPFVIDPGIIAVFLNACASDNPPAWCPVGVVAVLPPDPVPIPTLPPLVLIPGIDLLHANPIGPDTVQVIFTIPDGALPSLQFWDASGGSSGIGYATSIEPALLNGKLVQVAQFKAEPGASYQFLASAAGDGVRAVSRIGGLGP